MHWLKDIKRRVNIKLHVKTLTMNGQVKADLHPARHRALHSFLECMDAPAVARGRVQGVPCIQWPDGHGHACALQTGSRYMEDTGGGRTGITLRYLGTGRDETFETSRCAFLV